MTATINKNLLLVGGLVIFIIILGGASIFLKGNRKAPEDTKKTTEEQATKTKTSLKDLITSGKSQKCTFVDKSEDVDIEGVAYIGKGKLRADLNSDTGGDEIMAHVIINSGKSYIWFNGKKTGYMISFEESKLKAASGDQESVDIDKIINYSCINWKFDNGYFSPSPEVKFQNVDMTPVPTGS